MTEQEIKAEIFDVLVQMEKHQGEIMKLDEVKKALLKKLEDAQNEKNN